MHLKLKELSSKAQGTTEYLIILAVIIVIALVVVGVLTFIPGLGGGISEQQSQSYWNGASPFGLLAVKLNSTGSIIQITLQNNTSQKLTLNNVGIGSKIINDTNTLNPGEKKSLLLGAVTDTCTAGARFSTDVNFNYATTDLNGLMQKGDKTWVGKCI